jgi:hypothetical protein
LYTFSFVNTYILYIETPRPNTNRHVHAHKCWHCAGIEPATSCLAEYSHHYAKSAAMVARVVGYGSPNTRLWSKRSRIHPSDFYVKRLQECSPCNMLHPVTLARTQLKSKAQCSVTTFLCGFLYVNIDILWSQKQSILML